MTAPDLLTNALMHAAADQSPCAQHIRLLVAEVRRLRRDKRECESTMQEWAGLVESWQARALAAESK